MSKIVMIVAQNGFRDEEFLVPKEAFERAGHKITVASLTRTKATGAKGLVLQPDMAVYEPNPDFFDAFVVVGGPGSMVLAQSSDVINLLYAANQKGKVIGGICMGVASLASAGILANREVTAFPDRGLILSLREHGARYKPESCVIDGHIVTADGPMSAAKFGEAIVEMLKAK